MRPRANEGEQPAWVVVLLLLVVGAAAVWFAMANPADELYVGVVQLVTAAVVVRLALTYLPRQSSE